MNKHRVWVIEILIDDEWLTTADAYFTRKDARSDKLHYWEFNNPDDKFRIKKYIREEP